MSDKSEPTLYILRICICNYLPLLGGCFVIGYLYNCLLCKVTISKWMVCLSNWMAIISDWIVTVSDCSALFNNVS